MSSVSPTVARPSAGPGDGALLQTRRLSVSFPTAVGPVAVVDEVDVTIRTGRTLGLIGESGSGKTMLANALIGLLPDAAVVGGQILFRGEDLAAVPAARRRAVRGREISMVFQDPLSALNPTQRIWKQVSEIPRRDGASRADARRLALDRLAEAGVPEPAQRLDVFPHQLSGGLRQRVMIALALAGEPELLLADEPTTALDVTVQARILALLKRLQEERYMSMLLVSHDLRVVSHVAHDLVVMYAGRVCEAGPASTVIGRPAHPYTRALTRSIPSVHQKKALPSPLPGAPASPYARPSGCAFNPRCPIAQDICREVVPPVREVAPDRTVACHFAEEVLG